MNRQILKLAVPNIVSNLTVPLLTMVDLYLMGHLSSALFMGAVALGGAVFTLVYWGFAFLRMSVSGQAAQAFGEGAEQASAMVLYRGLLVALLGSLSFLALQVPIAELGFWLLKGSAEVKALAQNYYYVRIWAAPAAISLMVINGWFLGMQNARYPMIISVVINVVNIGASALMVRGFGMKETGVAWGSVSAQLFGLALAAALFHKRYRHIYPYFDLRDVLKLTELRHFASVSGDIFLRTLCVISVFTFFTSESAAYGDVALAANTALIQFLFLFSYFLDGFAYAAEAVVGRYVGERDLDKLKEATRKLFYWGAGFSGFFTLAYLLAGAQLLRVFTDRPEVLSYAAPYTWMAALIPLAGFVAYIWDGVFIGATASRAMLYTMLFSTIALYFIPYFALAPRLGNYALWAAILLYMLGRSLSQSLVARAAVFEPLGRPGPA